MALRSSRKFDFADVIQEYLKQYDGLTVTALTTVIPKVGREAAKKLRQTSPKDTGEYAAGWTVKVETGRINVGATVYGKKPTYQMAHLLEHGHLTRDGKRRVGQVEHIKKVEEWAMDEAVNQFIDYMESHTI